MGPLPKGVILFQLNATKELPIPQDCIISGIIRHREIILPRGVTVLVEGDEVLALVDEQARSQLGKLLGQTH